MVSKKEGRLAVKGRLTTKILECQVASGRSHVDEALEGFLNRPGYALLKALPPLYTCENTYKTGCLTPKTLGKTNKQPDVIYSTPPWTPVGQAQSIHTNSQ